MQFNIFTIKWCSDALKYNDIALYIYYIDVFMLLHTQFRGLNSNHDSSLNQFNNRAFLESDALHPTWQSTGWDSVLKLI